MSAATRSSTPSSRRRDVLRGSLTGVLVITALVVASCGGGSATTTTTPVDTTTTTSTAATTTSTTGASTTSTTGATTTLPGQPLDLGFPRAGDVIAVVGVAHDDVLNVRAVPGAGAPVVATASPTAADLVSNGRHRQLPGTIWHEVKVGGVTGWVNMSFLAYLGSVDDVTAQVVADMGSRPTAETMMDLGRIVARAMASDDPPSTIVMSVAPTVGDLGEVTYDVIGMGDDSVRGVRLKVFGQPTAGGEGFSLKSVERTILCGRGVTADGLCI